MNIPYIRLTEGYELLPFDCGDKDLNEFLTKDALAYQHGLFAVTYILENDKDNPDSDSTYAMYFNLSKLID